MMKHITVIVLILLVMFTTSCNSKAKRVKDIEQLSLATDSIISPARVPEVKDIQQADELIAKYNAFADDYPDDTLSAEFLFKGAVLCNPVREYDKELKMFERLVELFPQSQYAPKALSVAALVAERDKNDLVAARKYLTQIKENYPNSTYGDNIDLQIEYVGDAEGYLKAVMEKNGTSLEELLNSADSVDAVKK